MFYGGNVLFQSKTISQQFPTTFTIFFDLTREAVETLRAGASTRKRHPISPSKIPASNPQEQQYQDPNAKRMKTTQKTSIYSSYEKLNLLIQILYLL